MGEHRRVFEVGRRSLNPEQLLGVAHEKEKLRLRAGLAEQVLSDQATSELTSATVVGLAQSINSSGTSLMSDTRLRKRRNVASIDRSMPFGPAVSHMKYFKQGIKHGYQRVLSALPLLWLADGVQRRKRRSPRSRLPNFFAYSARDAKRPGAFAVAKRPGYRCKSLSLR